MYLEIALNTDEIEALISLKNETSVKFNHDVFYALNYIEYQYNNWKLTMDTRKEYEKEIR